MQAIEWGVYIVGRDNFSYWFKRKVLLKYFCSKHLNAESIFSRRFFLLKP